MMRSLILGGFAAGAFRGTYRLVSFFRENVLPDAAWNGLEFRELARGSRGAERAQDR
jgi:hypothetical protein